MRERKGGGRKFLGRKDAKLLLHQCVVIFFHLNDEKKSLNRLATTSKSMLSPVIQSKSGAIVSFP